MNKPYLVVENFFDQALAMREHFEHHFQTPYAQPEGGNRHRIWDYWYVPQLYTYMRTLPDKLFPEELYTAFYHAIQIWAIRTLGMSDVSWPYVSLYVNGCGQGLHNDSGNGVWGYVYSLTNWDNRKFTGGETLLFKEDNYWDSDRIRIGTGGASFYDLVPSRFNQLLVFDDRLIHAVQPLQGPMDPLEGRVVIHGHIRESGIMVEGTLDPEQTRDIITEAMPVLMNRVNPFGPYYHGMLMTRMQIAKTGQVEDVWILSNRIAKIVNTQVPEPAMLVQQAIDYLKTMRFPATDGPSLVTVPIRID